MCHVREWFKVFRRIAEADMMPSLRWYHVPAVLAFIFASKIQMDTFQQLQKIRRNRFGTERVYRNDILVFEINFYRATLCVSVRGLCCRHSGV